MFLEFTVDKNIVFKLYKCYLLLSFKTHFIVLIGRYKGYFDAFGISFFFYVVLLFAKDAYSPQKSFSLLTFCKELTRDLEELSDCAFNTVKVSCNNKLNFSNCLFLLSFANNKQAGMEEQKLNWEGGGGVKGGSFYGALEACSRIKFVLVLFDIGGRGTATYQSPPLRHHFA